LKGRKVAFCHQAWQEYVVKDIDCLLFFDDKVDLRMAANAVTNPLAALCLKYMLLDRNIKSFVVFGASSTLGTMLMRIALRKNLSPIAVVQDEEEIKRLRACLGDKVPMAKVDEAFELIEKEKPLVLIDLVGSERSGSLFERMPANSEMIVVGNLSNERLKLSTTEFFMHNKRLRGFNFERFLTEEVSEERRRELLKIIEDDINSGGEYFGLKEFKEFRLEDWNKALQEKGRVLIDFTEAPK
jgi:NADPH:quinone reductase-like Zn-dependent oxidoreductase